MFDFATWQKKCVLPPNAYLAAPNMGTNTIIGLNLDYSCLVWHRKPACSCYFENAKSELFRISELFRNKMQVAAFSYRDINHARNWPGIFRMTQFWWFFLVILITPYFGNELLRSETSNNHGNYWGNWEQLSYCLVSQFVQYSIQVRC